MNNLKQRKMNRDIKFRGKDALTGKWVFGDLAHNKKVTGDGRLEDRTMVGGYEVDPDTVGQFVGLCDAEGKEIYEGDILREGFTGYTFQVVYDAPEFCFKANDYGYRFLNRVENFEVAGNIHDNPELLKGGRK